MSLINLYYFSDVIIKLTDREIPAHKFVLSARTDFFGDSMLAEVTILGKVLQDYNRNVQRKIIYIFF